MAGRAPPRFVPTLTEVVQKPRTPATPPVPLPPSADQIAQRVLQRVDLVLDRKLREAIATVVVERIEAAVREAVAHAFAEEMKARQRPAP